MDRKEAIEALSVLKIYDAQWLCEAVDMAIEALSAEQKEEELAKDIARRMATIIENEQDMRVILKNASAELLKDGTLKVKTDNGADVKRVLVWGDDGYGGLYYADDRLTVEWKLASEELPQRVGSYIVTCIDEYGQVYVDYDYWTVADTFKYNRDKVIAWIPFPRPYCGTKMGSDTR